MHPPVRLVAIDMDGTLLPTHSHAISQRNAKALLSAQQAGITVVIATGRRMAYTTPLLENIGLRADTLLVASNGAVTRQLDGVHLHHCHMDAHVARDLCGFLRPFGAVVFTFDRDGLGELVLEDMEQAHGRIALWVEANRNAIQIVKPLENAFLGNENPIQGMVAGSLNQMREAERALKASPWANACSCMRTEYPARDLSILDLLPFGVSKATALQRLATSAGIHRSEVMAIGDNWNDFEMLQWSGQAIVMGNASVDLRAHAKTRGWKQAPSNEDDGVAAVLEPAIARRLKADRKSGLNSDLKSDLETGVA